MSESNDINSCDHLNSESQGRRGKKEELNDVVAPMTESGCASVVQRGCGEAEVWAYFTDNSDSNITDLL
nr:unnamed protein product [Haemonchus contortus]